MLIDDPALLAEFVTESRDHLADVEAQLLEIEASGADVNVELVNTVFRSIHSIKGAAGFMGLEVINKLSHSLENVLGKIRNREMVPTSAAVDVMLKSADVLASLINDIDNSDSVDVSTEIALLDRIHAEGAVELPPASSEAAPAQHESSPEDGKLAEPAAATPEPTATSQPPAEVTPAKAPAPSAPATSTPHESSVRVQVGVLDQLMNLAGELVLGRNQLLQTVGTQDQEGIQGVAARLDQVTSELQEAIMQTRMQPIGNVFNKFPRIVRDLSAKLKKQCDVVMEGKEVEVDKTIIEAIGDPLTHIIRNSVDHGVELPDARVAASKGATGTITLRAYHRAGNVRIDISDDGAGIDAKRLKDKAVAKGLITIDQADQLSDREAIMLIFHPGLSTAERVSDVSGRGVGMDVVRTNIEKIGGTVELESEPGVGTSLQITLPLTLAIIPSMLVRCRGARFAIPQVNIVELVRVREHEVADRISFVKDSSVLRLRGSLLPLVPLDRALKLLPGESSKSTSESSGTRHIVVLESGQTRYGLVVDQIDDSEEIVVKPLGQHLKSSSCLAGATILGDGHVAPILDVTGIASGCDINSTAEEAAEHHAERSATTADNTDVQSLLLFANCEGDHFAVPMGLVDRIERVRCDQIDSVGGQELLQYRGTSLPLLSVERLIKAAPRAESRNVHVVVFSVHGREAGLIAPQLSDIRQIAAEIDGDTFREPGVAGSLVIDEQTTRLLDLYELAQVAHPEWFVDKPKANAQGDRQQTILLAEDSTFFRKQVAQYIEGEGFRIVDAADGELAWEVLAAGEEPIDLVVTDIEMPNLDGLGLTRRIRGSAAHSHLPIIALTSLASEEDHQRGFEAGVDEYQTKFDRERVMNAIHKLLERVPARQ